MLAVVRWRLVLAPCLLWMGTVQEPLHAAPPTPDEALKLAPVQEDVDFTRPAADAISKCSVKAEKVDGQTGWVVRDADGQVLRKFLDTNADNVVDQWSYFSDGVEVYRDIDSDHNKKADQFRWLNTAGGRWALDADENGTIDSWKVISAEEVTAEVLRAIATSDAARFERVLLSATELSDLGLSPGRQEELRERLKGVVANFKSLAVKQKEISKDTAWIDFGASKPATIPAGTDGSTKDIVVYDNVVAMADTAGKSDQIAIGTLVRVSDTWKLLDVPQALTGISTDDLSKTFHLLPGASGSRQEGGEGGGNDAEYQRLLAELEKLDEKAGDAADQAAHLSSRSDLLEKIVEATGTAEDRIQWTRTLADHLSAGAQAGIYPEGVTCLQSLQDKLTQAGEDDQAAYVEFRHMTAKYGADSADPKANFAKIQTDWLENLEKFVTRHPQSSDAAEAMLQLAVAAEFAGQEDDAKTWYGKIADQFPDSPAAAKAGGARTRLDSVGQELKFRGTTTQGKPWDISQLRKRVVVLHWWATNCEPCKAEFAQLKELQAKYGKSLAIVGISLDSQKAELDAYLKRNALPWQQLFETGGLDSRLANELGIVTLPTMMLLDKQGKVVNRGIHVSELDREIKALID